MNTLWPSQIQFQPFNLPFSNSQTNPKIIFIGNPGSGKGTILNSLIRKVVFKSGISIGSGLTQILKSIKVGNIEYIDTPGLSDIETREKAAQEIKEALSRDGYYYLFFVVTLESGRLRPDDKTTMKLVLDALSKVEGLSYGIIVNKLSASVYERLQNMEEDMLKLYDMINNGLKTTTDKVCFLQNIESAEDKDNFLLPPLPKLEYWIREVCQPVRIDSGDVGKLKTEIELLKAELKASKNENKKQMETIGLLLLKIKMIESDKGAQSNEIGRESSNTLAFLGEILKEAHPTPMAQCLESAVAAFIKTPSWKKTVDVVLNCSNKNPYITFMKQHHLTLDEAHSITFYTSNDSRFGGDRLNSLHVLLNEMLVSRNDLTMWRDYLYHITKAFIKLPKYKGIVYRGIDVALDDKGKYKVGYEITYIAFSSATRQKNVALGFLDQKKQGTLLVIHSNGESGTPVDSLSLYPGETEVLFYPGSVFVVKSVNDVTCRRQYNIPSENITVIELEEKEGHLNEMWKYLS